jgi:hypothetical protein
MAKAKKYYSCSSFLSLNFTKAELEKIAGQKLTPKQAENLSGFIAAEVDGSFDAFFDDAAELGAAIWRDMGDDD